MIHFLPLEPACEAAPPADVEMLARVAGLKRALRLVEPFGGGPAPDFDEDFAPAIAGSGVAVMRCMDQRSERVISAAAAGLEAVAAVRSNGQEPHDAALARVAHEIRAGLADLSSLLRG